MPIVAAVVVIAEAVGAAIGIELTAGAIGSAVAGAVVGEAVAEGSILATTVGGAIIGAGSGALVSAVTGGDVLEGAALGAISGGIGGAVTPLLSEAVTAVVGTGNVANGITVALASEAGGTAAGLAQGQSLGEAALGALPGAIGAGTFVGSGLSDLLSETIDGIINPEGTEFTNESTVDTNSDGKITNEDTFADRNDDGVINEADLPAENASETGNAPLSEEAQAAVDRANLNKLQLKENPTPYEIWESAKAAADKGLLTEWANTEGNADAWNRSVRSGMLQTDPAYSSDMFDELVVRNERALAVRANAPVEVAQESPYGKLFDPTQAIEIAQDPEIIGRLLAEGTAKAATIPELVAQQNADAVQAAEQTYADTLTRSDREASAARSSNYSKLLDASSRNQQIIDFYQGLDQNAMLPTEKANLAEALAAQKNIETVMAKYDPTAQPIRGEVNYASYGEAPEVVQVQEAPITSKMVDASGYDPLSGRTTYNQPVSLVSNPNAYGTIGENSFYGAPTQIASTVDMPSTGLLGQGDIAGYTAQQYQTALADPTVTQAALADPTIQAAGINVAPLTITKGPDVSVPSGTGTTVNIPTITPKAPTQTADAGTTTGLAPDETYIVSPNIIPERPKVPDIVIPPLADNTFSNIYGGTLSPLGARGLADLGALSYYKYGYNPETPFYTALTTAPTTPTTTSTPAAAQGGYFDADAYFADGGLVASPRPPVQPTVASQPTMAYTDGQGLVGSIAAPPALSPFNSMGSDAPHASPMAPAPAAAVPTMTPDAPMLATKNINASPVSAPISQNPNLGYSLGMSPLARLAGLRNV